MWRSILSVIAGVVLWGVLWVGAGTALAGVFAERFAEDGTTSDSAMLGAFIVISIVLSILAGYVCATIARRRMMAHVTILAVIQLAIGIMVQASVWDAMPVWYHLIFLALVIPAHLVGGALRAKKAGTAAMPQPA